MVVIKRYVEAETKDIFWFWFDVELGRSVSPLFETVSAAADWAQGRIDKQRLELKPEPIWTGRNRRVGKPDRRSGNDRRTEIRYEPGGKDRRQSVGRRAEDFVIWDRLFLR